MKPLTRRATGTAEVEESPCLDCSNGPRGGPCDYFHAGRFGRLVLPSRQSPKGSGLSAVTDERRHAGACNGLRRSGKSLLVSGRDAPGPPTSSCAAVFAAAARVCVTRSGTAVVRTSRPVFRSSVDLVSVAAVVRDRRGRIVRDLHRERLRGLRRGRPAAASWSSPRPRTARSAWRCCSTRAAACGLGQPRRRPRRGRAPAGLAAPGTRRGGALCVRQRRARVHGFTSDPDAIARALPALDAFGSTALYDAIGAWRRSSTSGTTGGGRVVVVTDGLDTSSRAVGGGGVLASPARATCRCTS